MDDPDRSHTFEELAVLPTVHREKLFADRTVLVSGAARGIGLALAASFGPLGATIVTCGRDPEKPAAFEHRKEAHR